MLRVIQVIAALITATSAYAQINPSGGLTDALNSASTRALQRAQQTEALQAWTRCLKATNDATKCGPPPQVNQTALQAPQYQGRPIAGGYDFQCMSLCTNAEYSYTFCQMQCRNR